VSNKRLEFQQSRNHIPMKLIPMNRKREAFPMNLKYEKKRLTTSTKFCIL
jgi:hypothetical protein